MRLFLRQKFGEIRSITEFSLLMKPLWFILLIFLKLAFSLIKAPTNHKLFHKWKLPILKSGNFEENFGGKLVVTGAGLNDEDEFMLTLLNNQVHYLFNYFFFNILIIVFFGTFIGNLGSYCFSFK